MSYVIERLPTELIDVFTLEGGTRVTMRPVLPQDAALERILVRGLSLRARTQRFLAPIADLPDSWLARMTQIDFRSHVGVIAETFDGGAAEPVAEARYVVDDDGASAEFAVVVADAWQRRGIARRLLGALLCHARAQAVPRLRGDALADNHAMIGLARSAGFSVRRHPGDARLVLLEQHLAGSDAARTAFEPCPRRRATAHGAAPARAAAY